MARRKTPLPVFEEIEIKEIAAEGKALAKINDMVVFVPWVAPGDVVDIQLTKKRKSYAEGRAVNIRRYSKERAAPFCEHFTICGGCKWQHIPYEKQLFYKQKQVLDNISRIGGIEVENVYPIIGSEHTKYYRNKLEYTFSNRRWFTYEEIQAKSEDLPRDGVGFHIPGMFDKVLDINDCLLQNERSNKIRLFIKDFCIRHRYPFFDLRAQQGFIRTLIVRTSSTGELMIIVVFFEEEKEKREKLLHAVKEQFPEITSLMYVINSKCNDTIADLEVLPFHGKDHLIEKMEELQFKVGPKSFYQTNSSQAYKLYCVTRGFAGLTGNEVVYDLYTGTGTIANFIAHEAQKVIGVEYIPEAIENAKVNAKMNNIDNIEFFAGDMRKILNKDFIAEHGHPEVIITDPPRSGMHDDVTDTIIESSPHRIVYVSCNPATQARDIKRLSTKYSVAKMQPIDMFPHTHHVENVALLELK